MVECGRHADALAGDEPSDKTRPERLWPSDHAAVVGTLDFE